MSSKNCHFNELILPHVILFQRSSLTELHTETSKYCMTGQDVLDIVIVLGLAVERCCRAQPVRSRFTDSNGGCATADTTIAAAAQRKQRGAQGVDECKLSVASLGLRHPLFRAHPHRGSRPTGFRPARDTEEGAGGRGAGPAARRPALTLATLGGSGARNREAPATGSGP